MLKPTTFLLGLCASVLVCLAFSNSARLLAADYDPLPFAPAVKNTTTENRGDVNADGVINVGDVVYLATYLYRGGPPPEPPWAGDCSCDGVVELGDMVYLVGYLFKDGPPPACPIGFLVSYQGCKHFSMGGTTDTIPPDQDCMTYQCDGAGLLLLRHVNAGFNCCPTEILADLTIDDDSITIVENESLEDGGCYCLCLFDVDYRIDNLPAGEYTIRVYGMYLQGGPILEFTVDLASSPSGTYCVHRDYYPWGIR